jgi:hypothetical protein
MDFPTSAAFDWWKWVSVFAVFFMTGTIVRIGLLRLRRWRARRGIKVNLAPEKEEKGQEERRVPVLGQAIAGDSASLAPDAVDGQAASNDTATLPAPVTPALTTADHNRLPTLSPGQESDDLPARTGKKRRRKRGKGKGKGVKTGGEDGDSDEDDEAVGVEGMDKSPGVLKNGLQLETTLPVEPVDAANREKTAVRRKEAMQKMDGLTVSDDVLGKSLVDEAMLVANFCFAVPQVTDPRAPLSSRASFRDEQSR